MTIIYSHVFAVAVVIRRVLIIELHCRETAYAGVAVCIPYCSKENVGVNINIILMKYKSRGMLEAYA